MLLDALPHVIFILFAVCLPVTLALIPRRMPPWLAAVLLVALMLGGSAWELADPPKWIGRPWWLMIALAFVLGARVRRRMTREERELADQLRASVAAGHITSAHAGAIRADVDLADVRHVRTDPACRRYRAPRPGSRLDRSSRGKPCPACVPARELAPAWTGGLPLAGPDEFPCGVQAPSGHSRADYAPLSHLPARCQLAHPHPEGTRHAGQSGGGWLAWNDAGVWAYR